MTSISFEQHGETNKVRLKKIVIHIYMHTHIAQATRKQKKRMGMTSLIPSTQQNNQGFVSLFVLSMASALGFPGNS
jgi:hypothetical protein